ncbi:MAG TPA: hypothetical protein VFK13_05455 [Gemmatimonadaceae bacterium]|nr:hypothetical protein [Gemmatimonadaceae bacterium]
MPTLHEVTRPWWERVNWRIVLYIAVVLVAGATLTAAAIWLTFRVGRNTATIVLLWPVFLIVRLLHPSIGTPEHRLNEGTIADVHGILLGILLAWMFYSLVVHGAVHAWGRWISHRARRN